MAETVTMDKLEKVVELLNRMTRHTQDYSLDVMTGQGIRLVSHKGSTDVSPRMKRTELYYWIHAFIDGVEIGQQLGRG